VKDEKRKIFEDTNRLEI